MPIIKTITPEGELIDQKLLWVDFTRRTDPSTTFWVRHLESQLQARGYPRVFCFWTKAPGTVAELYKDIVKDMQRHGTLVLAQVTYNGYTELEPGVTAERSNLAPLVDLLGPSHIRLRFDPIIVGFTKPEHFERCLEAASRYKITRIITNFILLSYKDVRDAMAEFGVDREATREEKADILAWFVDSAVRQGTEIGICAETIGEGLAKDVPGLKATGCADMNWAIALKPELLNAFKKRPSRPGCQCCYTDDWGLYSSKGGQKCPHLCLYCYAK